MLNFKTASDIILVSLNEEEEGKKGLVGFQHPLSDREALEVTSLLSLLQNQHMILGRNDVRFWTPILLGASLAILFFLILSSHSPSLVALMFSSLES